VYDGWSLVKNLTFLLQNVLCQAYYTAFSSFFAHTLLTSWKSGDFLNTFILRGIKLLFNLGEAAGPTAKTPF